MSGTGRTSWGKIGWTAQPFGHQWGFPGGHGYWFVGMSPTGIAKFGDCHVSCRSWPIRIGAPVAKRGGAVCRRPVRRWRHNRAERRGQMIEGAIDIENLDGGQDEGDMSGRRGVRSSAPPQALRSAVTRQAELVVDPQTGCRVTRRHRGRYGRRKLVLSAA